MKRLRPSRNSAVLLPFLTLPLLLLLIATPTALAGRTTNPSNPPKNAVLLSKVSTLTLRADQLTASRRVPAVPQAKCTGPSQICALYTVDILRCTNEGSDYDDENIQWTCTASLPEEFKLGSTDVTCEGYESSDDPFVLKGSCGVEYRLLLTEKGEEKFGKGRHGGGGGGGGGGGSGGGSKSSWGSYLFWLIFLGVLAAIVLSALGCFRRNRNPPAAQGWNGGGGPPGGPGGDDPPPPYNQYQTFRKQPSSRSYWPGAAGSAGPGSSLFGGGGGNSFFGGGGQGGSSGGGWRPGFWSGLAGGAAAGYAAGGRNSGHENQNHYQHQHHQNGGGFWGNNGGNSRSSSSGSSNNGRGGGGGGDGGWNSTPDIGSDRYESTGFGSTSRR